MNQTPPAAERPRLVLDVGRVLLLAAVYFLMARASMPAHISFVWLPAGVSLAALLVGGLRLAPGIAVGAFAAQYSVGESAWICAVLALGSVLSAMAGTWLLERKFAFSRALDRPRDVLSFIGVGAFLSPLIAATLGGIGAYWGHADSWREWGALWAGRWAGDALGVLLLAPVLLCWIGTRRAAIVRGATSLALAALQLLVGGYVFALHSGPGAGPYVYLSLALLTAMHLPLSWVTVLGLVTFCAAAVGTLQGSGPFAAALLQDSMLSLQAYGLVSSLATLLVSSLAQQRASVAGEIAETKRFLDALIDTIPTPVLVKDERHRYIGVNASFCQFFRNPPDRILGKTDFDFFAPNDAAFYQKTDDEALNGLAPVAYERPYTIGDDVRWMLVRKSALTRPDGSRVVVLVLIDVTERRAAEEQLRASEARFRDFAAAAGEYVWEADLEGRITYVSSRVQSVWGYSDQELMGRAPAELMPPGEAERVRDWLRHYMRQDGSFNDLEHMIVNRQGETRWVLINAVGIFDATGKRIGQRGTGRDITDRKTAEARISYLATRDPLTELPNRVLFNDRLEQGIVAARRTGQSLALLFVDLDRFKNINDSLGHQVGDLLLKEVANRMHGCIRKGDTLSRLGGDEFVVTLEGLQQAEDAAQVAAKIIKALSRPCEIVGHTLNTSCSIGISIYPLDADDDRALMKNADTAMYHAKEKGRNNYQFFSPEMNVRAVERHTLETALRVALERGEFVLYYQPQVDMRSGKIVGLEALLRWRHPERGTLSPATFMAVAEESGLIEPIGQWVLRTACQRAKTWLDNGYPPLKVAVNISPRELIHPREFARDISRILGSTGLDPRYLELEMTESLLVQNAEENIAVLRKLGQEGVRIAVDDFGTGYSSLSYIKQLPIDTLKIDRSFVRDIERDPDMEIIRAIVAMAHSLGLQVTAEGVETRGQLEALTRLGCDEYQGYFFSKPLPAVEIAARFLAPGELDFEATQAG